LRIIQVDEKVSFAKAIQGQGFTRGQWLIKAGPTASGL
jgi:hypothetical protein